MNVAEFLKVPLIKGDLGVEIELEGVDLYKGYLHQWRVEADGSLRGEDNAEYVLKEPLDLPEVENALNTLEAYLEEFDSQVILSRRTSTHIHVNVTELDTKHLLNFIALLFTFEDFLVNWCAPSRKGNLFCLRSRDAEAIYDSLRPLFNSASTIDLNNYIRYSAINLAALLKYGSVEIRSLEGTMDVDRILTWCSMLLRLREVAQQYENPISIIQDMSELGDVAFAKKVLGEYSKILFVGKGRKKLLIDCIRRSQDLAFEYNPKAWAVKEQKEKVVEAERIFIGEAVFVGEINW